METTSQCTLITQYVSVFARFRVPLGRPRPRLLLACSNCSRSSVFLFFEPLGRPLPRLGSAESDFSNASRSRVFLFLEPFGLPGLRRVFSASSAAVPEANTSEAFFLRLRSFFSGGRESDSGRTYSKVPSGTDPSRFFAIYFILETHVLIKSNREVKII